MNDVSDLVASNCDRLKTFAFFKQILPFAPNFAYSSHIRDSASSKTSINAFALELSLTVLKSSHLGNRKLTALRISSANSLSQIFNFSAPMQSSSVV